MIPEVELRNLVSLIPDESLRENQGLAVEAWIASFPGRSSRQMCPGCGESKYNRKGRLCVTCMTSIVRSAVDACREKGQGGEPLSIQVRSYWNRFPLLTSRTKVPEDAAFTRLRKPGEAPSASGVFERLMSELARLSLAGFKPVPPSTRAEGLLGGSSGASSESLSGMAPLGFKKVFHDVTYFTAWIAEQSYRDGFEAGQNLLASMASGTMTHEDFTVKVLQQEGFSQKRVKDMIDQKARPR